MILRPTQTQALSALQAGYSSGMRKLLLCAHTAFGKSTLTGTMLNRTSKSVLYLCHREELLERVVSDLTAAGIRYGVIAGAQNALPNTYRVHVGMVPTVARRLDRLPPFQWVISDEAHLAASETWSSILARYADAWHLGMSASPCRLDGKPLGKYYDQIIYGPSIRESTSRGYLVPIRVFAPTIQQFSEKTSKLSLDKAAELLNTPKITGSAIGEMRKRAPDRQFMVFTCNRKHSEDVAAQFRDEGISAISVDSTMADRKERFRAFETKRVQGLVNVELATTGYDYPPVSLGIFLRDTDSLALYLQICGRFVRTSPGKVDALIHDHVGVVLRHGLPDADREWTLEGREKRSGQAVAVRQCQRCYCCFAPAPKCPECGYVFPVKSTARRAIETIDGELAQVDEVAIQRIKKEQISAMVRGCTDLKQMQELAHRLGFKPGWAWMQWSLRQRLRRRRAA